MDTTTSPPPPQASPSQPYPSVLQALGLAGFTILMSLVVGIFLLLLSLLFPNAEGAGIMDRVQSGQEFLQLPWVFLITYLLSFIPVVLLGVYLKRKQEKIKTVFDFRSIPLAVYPFLVISTLGIVYLLDPLTDLIPWEIPESMMAFVRQKNFFIFLAMVFAAPILEELIFRGLMLEGLLKRMSPWGAILFTSFLFGLVHMNPWQFIGAFFLGAFMGWIYWKTRSLIPCMFIHFVANLNGYLMRYFIDFDAFEAGNLPSTRDAFGSMGMYLAFLAGCLAMVAVSIYLINRWVSKQEPIRMNQTLA